MCFRFRPVGFRRAQRAAALSAADPRTFERHVTELEALREIAAASSEGIAEIPRLVGERARELFGADCAAILLSDPETLTWRSEGPQGEELVERVAVLLARSIGAGETTVSEALAELGCEHVGTVLGVQLRGGNDVQGVLLLGWKTRQSIPKRRVRLAETLGVQLAVALRHARLYEEMRLAAIRRDRFFSSMSHDLRTPITAIVGYSELLLDGIVGPLSPPQHEMVERISQVSSHLSQLVGDILDLTRLDAGRAEFHRERIRLSELVGEATVTVGPQAHGKGIRLVLDVADVQHLVLDTDRFRVRQILVNLLSNAVKFTPEGEVRVTAGTGPGRSWIAVQDTGPGLPAGSEEAVFEEFLQLPSGNGGKKEPGSGLGLAISRRLARALGGELVAERRPVGATFTLYLPTGTEW